MPQWIENIFYFLWRRWGFPDRWRGWINECLSSSRVLVLLNGSPYEEFQLGRGLRRRDHLSLFLFLIVAKGLSAMIKKLVANDCFKGVVLDKQKSHLQFADDTLVFVRKVGGLFGL